MDGEMTDIKQVILDEAGKIVNGARRSAYGKPEMNFIRIARFWQAYFDNTGRKIEITAADVSPMMRLMKEARLCESPDHYDSFVDIVGYTLCGAEVNEVETVKPVESIGAGVVERVGKNDKGSYIGLTRNEGEADPKSEGIINNRVTLGGHTAADYAADPNSYQHRIGKPERNE